MTDLGKCIQAALSERVSTKDRIAALRQIAEIGGPRDAAVLMHIVLARKKAIGRVAIAFEQVLFGVQGDVITTAAKTVARLMNKVEAAEWTSLYASFRNVSMRREDVACLDQFATDQAVHLLGIATLNQNGYVREDATGRLGAIRSPEVLPYLLLRLADWVPEVRTTAERILHASIQRGLAGRLLDCLYLFRWMERVERVDLSEARKSIIAALVSEHPEDIRRGLDNKNPDVRLLCYQALLTDWATHLDLAEKVIGDPAVQVRLWAVTKIVSARPPNTIAWLSKMLADRASSVRLAALHGLASGAWSEVESHKDRLLVDSAGSVRDAARYYFVKNGLTDIAGWYRKNLQGAGFGAGPGAIAGLSEVEGGDDFILITSYVSHPRAIVRAAAISGIARLKSEGCIPLMVQALNDRSAKVRRAAIWGFMSNRLANARDLLLPYMQSGMPEGRVAALRVLASLESWEGLRDILFAITCGDPVLVDPGWQLLEKWVASNANHLFTKPSKPLAAEILNSAKLLCNSSGAHDETQVIAKRLLGMLRPLLES